MSHVPAAYALGYNIGQLQKKAQFSLDGILPFSDKPPTNADNSSTVKFQHKPIQGVPQNQLAKGTFTVTPNSVTQTPDLRTEDELMLAGTAGLGLGGAAIGGGIGALLGARKKRPVAGAFRGFMGGAPVVPGAMLGAVGGTALGQSLGGYNLLGALAGATAGGVGSHLVGDWLGGALVGDPDKDT